MTTFKLPATSESLTFDYLPEGGTSIPLPNIDVIPPESHYLASTRQDAQAPVEAVESIDVESQLDADDIVFDSDDPLVATQPQTQSQHHTFDPQVDQHLVGRLIPATPGCKPFELSKDKANGEWTIGRHHTNDFMLPGLRLSNHHCKLKWNGLAGRCSQVTLEDNKSTNGTYVNNVHLTKGESAILTSGAAITFGGDGEADYSFVFRDIEGQPMSHAHQLWAKYDVGRELGAGAFARVYLCIERATGVEYAVKIIEKSRLRRLQVNEQSVAREITILQYLAEFRHKNIVSLHEHFEEKDSIYLIMELVQGGDLLTYLAAHGTLGEDKVRRLAAQICHAVAYIHSQGVTHRDLKPENIMMTMADPPDCKVADFGLAKLVDDQTFLKTMCGTPAYLAPEVMLRSSVHQAYDSRVDSWSLGIIFYAMLTNHQPFPCYDPTSDAEQRRRYFKTRQADWKFLHSVHLSDNGFDFLRNLLTEDPRDRKSVAQMLDHPWICRLVPSDSQFQRPQSQTQSSPTPSTTDGAVACSESFQELNLSDMAIPGLSPQKCDISNGVDTMSISRPTTSQVVESVTPEVSVSAMIPGAFPKTRKGRQPLAIVEEAVLEHGSWDFLARPIATDPSRDTKSPTQTPSKRKSELIAGSSPLTSLSSDDDLDEETVIESPKKLPRRGVVPRSKGRPIESSANKRRFRPPSSSSRPPSSSSRPRGAAAPKEEQSAVRKSVRRQQPTAKVPRYI